MTDTLRVAYADPPYLGCGRLYKDKHPSALDCDTVEWHAALIERLCDEFPDGWALSLHTPSLKTMLNLCPSDVRIGAWVKPFCSFKPNVNPAYAWEPYIWRGGRKRQRTQPTIRDWVSCNITLKKGLTGAKPEGFCVHIFQTLNLLPGDDLIDLFPGTGLVGAAWDKYKAESE